MIVHAITALFAFAVGWVACDQWAQLHAERIAARLASGQIHTTPEALVNDNRDRPVIMPPPTKACVSAGVVHRLRTDGRYVCIGSDMAPVPRWWRVDALDAYDPNTACVDCGWAVAR